MAGVVNVSCGVEGCTRWAYRASETRLLLCFPHLDQWHSTPVWIDDTMFLKGANYVRVVIWPWV